MSESIKIDFAAIDGLKADSPLPGAAGQDGAPRTAVILAGKGLTFGAATKTYLGTEGVALVEKAAATAKFKAKVGSSLDLIAPAGFSADRLIVFGVGGEAKGSGGAGAKDAEKPFEATNLGGSVVAKLGRGARGVVLFDLPRETDDAARAVAEFATGLRLRDYRFDAYKTKKKDDDADDKATRVTIARSPTTRPPRRRSAPMPPWQRAC